MTMPQKILQHIVFPPNSSKQFVSYIFELLLACGGFPGDIHFGQNIQEFNAVFFSQESQGTFNIQYGKALKGDFSVSIWEKVNGPYMSEQKRQCLTEFHKFLKDITPVITFIEANGGWPTPKEFNGFKPLEDSLHYRTAPLELKISSDKLTNAMAIFSFICDILEKYPSIEAIPKDNIDISFKKNICHLYIDFSRLYVHMKPLIVFIEANGGWPEGDDNDFPGFSALRSSCSSGNLSQEVMDSFHCIENFMKFYLIGSQFMISNNVIPQIIPHSQS